MEVCYDEGESGEDPKCMAYDMSQEPITYFEQEIERYIAAHKRLLEMSVAPGEPYRLYGEAVAAMLDRTKSIGEKLVHWLGGIEDHFLHRGERSFSARHRADASYAAAGFKEMAKFKEEVIQGYLGRPSVLFGQSPRESREFADPEPQDPAFVSSLKPIPSPRVSMQSQSGGIVGGAPVPSGSTHSAKMHGTSEGSMGSKSGPSSPTSDKPKEKKRGLRRFWNYFGSSKVQSMGAESVTIEPGNQPLVPRERKGLPQSSKVLPGDCSESFSSLSIPQP
eukprot:s3444_g6.t1